MIAFLEAQRAKERLRDCDKKTAVAKLTKAIPIADRQPQRKMVEQQAPATNPPALRLDRSEKQVAVAEPIKASTIADSPPQPDPISQQAPATNPPLLRLPSELRLKILDYCITDPDEGPFILFLELPHLTIPKRPVRNIFLINRLLHDEAEEALWKNNAVVLDSNYHYKYPFRESPILQLSDFAYAGIREFYLPLHVCRHSAFANIKTGYNTVLGNVSSTSRLGGTWRFEQVARRLSGLKLLRVEILGGEDLPARGCFRRRMVEGIIGIIGMFSSEDIIIACSNPLLEEDLIIEARYRIRDSRNMMWESDTLSKEAPVAVPWNHDSVCPVMEKRHKKETLRSVVGHPPPPPTRPDQMLMARVADGTLGSPVKASPASPASPTEASESKAGFFETILGVAKWVSPEGMERFRKSDMSFEQAIGDY